MSNYLVRRFVYTIIVMWLASLVVFFALRITPGDPANFVVDPVQSAAVKARIRHQLGLDQPIPTQYWHFAKKVVTLNFGSSFVTRQPINTIVGQAAPHTLLLAGAAGILVLGLGIPIGVIAGVRRNGWLDRGIGLLGPLAMGVPSFVLAIILVKVLALELRWLPVSGSGSLQALIMPAVVLAIEPLVVTIRMMRASVVEQLGLDYVRTLRAKGLSERRILWQHVLRNSLGPIFSLSAVQFRSLLGYTLIVEIIFNWPGLGEALVNSVLSRDYPVAQILALLLTLAVIFLSFLADLGLAFSDPRLRRRPAG